MDRKVFLFICLVKDIGCFITSPTWISVHNFNIKVCLKKFCLLSNAKLSHTLSDPRLNTKSWYLQSRLLNWFVIEQFIFIFIQELQLDLLVIIVPRQQGFFFPLLWSPEIRFKMSTLAAFSKISLPKNEKNSLLT